MARSRKFRTSRRIPDSERSLFEQKLSGRYTRTLDRNDLLNIIRGGEDTYVEFKIRLVNLDKITSEIVALANTGGGALIFGVNDQRRVEGLDDPEEVEEQLIEICRTRLKPALLPRIDKVSFDNGARIVVLQVDDRRGPHSTLENEYYIRIGSTKREADGNEIAQLFANSRFAYFEDLPVSGLSVEDLDEALIWSYIRDAEGERFREPGGFPTPEALSDLGLGVSRGGRIVPTLAGLMLFGRTASIEEAVVQSRVSLTRLSGTDQRAPVIEHADIFGNLTTMFDRAMSFIKRYADVWDSRPPKGSLLQHPEPEGFPVRARANYPREPIVETITNLLVHRNYSVIGGSSSVLIFDDRIEFINPIRGMEIKKRLIEYGAATRPNPRMHGIFTRKEYGIEQVKRGVPALRRGCYSFSRKEARISLNGDELRLELPGI